jgi:type II secretory pathway pseudopilin PulG
MKRQQGFTYLGLLLAVALIGLGLSVASEVWTSVARRQKLEQLEFVGQQFVQAIGSYYESTPGLGKKYPQSLQDLVEDRRNAFIRRHLRRIYLNPFTAEADWELVGSPDGGVRGIRVLIPRAELAGAEPREFVYIPGR